MDIGSKPIEDPGKKQESASNAWSQVLFSSQSSSQGSLITEQIDITLQLTEYIWVQCDNPDCQKWRKIQVVHADSLDDNPWYCYMNSDPAANTCSSPEENHAQYDRMAKKAGIKFVMSMLNVGCLVWAKLAGYCRWPALITRDPDSGVHVMVDIDGDPHSYHIEFLGNPHTHSWVAAKHVEVYGHRKIHEVMDSEVKTSLRSKRKPGRGRWNESQGKGRTSFKRVHILEVIQKEANHLLTMSPEERMSYCIFQFVPPIVSDNQMVPASEDKKEKGSYENSGKRKRRQQKQTCITQNNKTYDVVDFDMKKVKQGTDQKSKTLHTKKKNNDFSIKYGRSGKEGKSSLHKEQSLESGVELSYDDGLSVPTVKTEPSGFVFDSPNQFSQSQLKFTNTMVDKTKEEKFTIDIDMYRKNEMAFEHDVRRFLTRNGQKIRSTPIWHKVPIGLFQLYLAVHERGGFKMVTHKKLWTSVYKELTEQQHVTSGSVAKLYYEKNLYPYELFVSGKDYTSALSKFRRPCPMLDTQLTSKTVTTNIQDKGSFKTYRINPGAKHETCEMVDTAINKDDAVLPDEDSVSYSQDIEAILGVLEDDYNTIMSATKSPEKTSEGRGIDIKFYDESTDSPSGDNGNVAKEFQKPTTTDDGILQEIPNVDMSDERLSSALSDIHEKILHEMKALEDEMLEINSELDIL